MMGGNMIASPELATTPINAMNPSNIGIPAANTTEKEQTIYANKKIQ